MDLLSVDHKALVGQREAALLAVEAVLVPRESLIVHHVGAVAEPCGERRTAVSQQCETGNHASHTDLFKTFLSFVIRYSLGLGNENIEFF